MRKRNVRIVVLGLGAIHILFVGCGGGGEKSGTGQDDGGRDAINSAVTSDAKVPPDALICEQLAAGARAQFMSTLSLACQVDSDCSVLHLRSLNCFAACGQPARVADIPAVTAVATSACDQYFGAGCPEIFLTCPASPLRCDQGQCSTVLPTGASADAAVDASAGEVLIDGGSTSMAHDSALEDASASPDGGACTWPAKLTSTSDGSAVGCWAHTISGTGNASQIDCSSADYALGCVGEWPYSADGGSMRATVPQPDPSLGCRILPIPTSVNTSFYCCPCNP